MVDRCVLAIGPGAFAIFFPGNPRRVFAEELEIASGDLIPHSLASRIALYGPALAVIERAKPRPRDGLKGALQIGARFGAARTVVALASLPETLVSPKTWRKVLGLQEGDAEAARALAIDLFPDSVAHFAQGAESSRAEAALLAKYAAEKLT